MEELNKKIKDIGQINLTLDYQMEDLMKEITSMTKAVEHFASKIRQIIQKIKCQKSI